jgi:hypothetical protein
VAAPRSCGGPTGALPLVADVVEGAPLSQHGEHHSALRSRPRRLPGSLAAVPHRELSLALRTQSLRAVAKHYGVSRNTARYWRDQLGLTSPAVPGHPGRGPTLQPLILSYLRAHHEGATRTMLAQALDDTPLMLYRCLRRLEARGLVTRTLEQMPGRFESQSRWFLAPEPADRAHPQSSVASPLLPG